MASWRSCGSPVSFPSSMATSSTGSSSNTDPGSTLGWSDSIDPASMYIRYMTSADASSARSRPGSPASRPSVVRWGNRPGKSSDFSALTTSPRSRALTSNRASSRTCVRTWSSGTSDPTPPIPVTIASTSFDVGGGTQISIPLFRMARETSPPPRALGSSARISRNSGCGTMTLTSSSTIPRSVMASTPLGSSSGFSRSSTAADARLALSSRTHAPVSSAEMSAPSSHSNRPMVEPRPRGSDASRADSTRSVSSSDGSSGLRSSTTTSSPASMASASPSVDVGNENHASASAPTSSPSDNPPPSARRTSGSNSRFRSDAWRTRSICSNPPSNSMASTECDIESSTSDAPESAAAVRISDVFPDAGGPTRRGIHPIDRTLRSDWSGRRCATSGSAPYPPRSSVHAAPLERGSAPYPTRNSWASSEMGGSGAVAA